jgi:NTE family protein
MRGLHSDQQGNNVVGRYTLGGFQNLSGYKPGQIEGNYLLFGRLSYYYRLTAQPVLTRGFFVGGTLEAGNAWDQRAEMKLGDLRHSGTIFLGADTVLGPLYLGLYYAPSGSSGVYLLLGRP